MPPSEPLLAWHEQVERTLLLWRTGRRLARPRLHSPQGRAYMRAIAISLIQLQRHTTMDELVRAYATIAPSVKLVVLEDGVSQGLVEDVSYWLRLVQLVGQRERAR